MTITCSRLLKPSSSTSSWFSVWSCSRLNPRPRARGADGVELVDEDDCWSGLARILEELADAGGAEAREHLDERRGALRVEARARLVSDGLGEQGLAGARGAVEENPFRHARAEGREPLRIAQEVNDLLHLRAWPLPGRRPRPR